jgi:UDP-N-acetylglucosamine 2-epimerase (non-hydrolysing)
MKIMFVFGTRPEAIKLYPLIVRYRKSHHEVIVCSTGQQKELLDETLQSLNLNVDIKLQLMTVNQKLSTLTSKLIDRLDLEFNSHNPDLVFIHGDTTTSMAAGLVANYNSIKVVHVEAGLRSKDLQSPWPEEMNRRINALTSSYHLTPTEQSMKNLFQEGLEANNVFISGNTGLDTLRLIKEFKSKESFLNPFDKFLDSSLDSKKVVLITIHRRENFKVLDSIFNAIKTLANSHDDLLFIYPVHLNPNVKNKAETFFDGVDNLLLLDPLPYLSFVKLLSRSYFVITDSGGIQEEATFSGIPIVLCRTTTERPEGLKSGNIILAGTSTQRIIELCEKLIHNKDFYVKAGVKSNVFGDGYASEKIFDWLEKKI